MQEKSETKIPNIFQFFFFEKVQQVHFPQKCSETNFKWVKIDFPKNEVTSTSYKFLVYADKIQH